MESKAELNYFNPLSAGKYRNNPCVCGSGKKIKKCHGIKSTIPYTEYKMVVQMINDFNTRFKTEFEAQAKKAMDAMDEQKQETENIDQQPSR